MTGEASQHDEIEEPRDSTVQEPANSTVDDWMGQAIARDEEVAERARDENDDLESAEQQFEREAHGERDHRQGYPRPGSPEDRR